MTLPANDAFTLGLPHDPARLGLRSSSSSSSKIPFVSSPKARSPSLARRSPAPARSSHAPTRQMSVERTDHLRSSPVHSPTSNGSAASPNGSAVRHRKTPRSSSHTSPSTPSQVAASTGKAARPPVDWEIPRKTLHSSIGFLTLYLYASNGDPRKVVLALSVALAFIVPCDILRFRSARFEWLFERCVGFLMRESEKKTTNGVIWYIIGVIFVLAVYPLDIATVSILILSWADTAASTIGRLLGPYTAPLPRRLPLLRLPLAPRKSLAGFIAGSLTGAAIAVGFWGAFAPSARAAQLDFRLPAGLLLAAEDSLPGALAEAVRQSAEWVRTSGLPVGRWIGLATLGTVCGLISGTAEALDLGSLDDNLTLPIISGGCIWGFFKALEYFTGTSVPA